MPNSIITIEKFKNPKPLFIALFFAVLFVFQIINLDSDPSMMKRIGDVGDEGSWVHNARSLALFGTSLPDQWNQPLVGAPIFTFLTFLSYKILGVSLFSSRILSLVSLWLIMLMIFLLLKKYVSLFSAVFSIVFIGFIHELLIYAKWGTPILFEMLFLVALIFFWDLAQKNKLFYILAGTMYPLALLSKMSSVYFIVALLLFVACEFLIRREVNFKDLLLFILGSLSVVVPWFIFFFLPFQSQYVFFLETIGHANVGQLQGIKNFIYGLFSVPFANLLKYPSFVILDIFTFFWIILFLRDLFKDGIKNSLAKINVLELYSFFWLVGGLFMIGISPDKSDRRFVMFIVPLAILSISFLFNKKIDYDFSVFNKILNIKLIKAVALIISLISIAIFAKYPLVSLNIKELLVILIILSTISLISIKNKIQILLFILFGAIFTHYFMGAIQMMNLNWFMPLGVDIHAYILYLAFAIFSFYIAYLFFFKNNKKLIIILLLSVFFIYNIAMNYIWYAGATFTMEEASKDIRQYSTSGTPLTGGDDAHLLAVENFTQPIWFLKGQGRKIYGNINGEYDFESKNFLLIEYVIFNTIHAGAPANDTYLTREDFAGRNIKYLKQIKLWPYPFTSKYRNIYNLYEIN